MLSFIGILPVHFLLQSHPTWVRGLKLKIAITLSFSLSVAPYLGAWIEILLICKVCSDVDVAPYLGAWIEMMETLICQIQSK